MMKREIDFIKFNPTQNMTILVKTKHPVETYQQIASKIMSYDSLYAEQVGFIEKPMSNKASACLQMAGGEFCGNACMSLAAYIAAQQGCESVDVTEIILEASGTDGLIVCQVKKLGDSYRCQLAMPVPHKVEQRTVTYEGQDLDIVIVRYQNCIHIVIEVNAFNDAVREKAQTLAKLLGVTLGANLIGILLFRSDTTELEPLIYIPLLDSMVWERGCGSGTASVGAYMAWKRKGAISAPIRQSGGTIHVKADCEQGAITHVTIEGCVAIVAEGTAYIDV